MVPKYCFLTKGVGRNKEKLVSFEAALRKAGIAQYNIVEVSSILPPKYKSILKKKDLEKLVCPGQIIYCVMAKNHTNEPHRLIAASIGVAIPKNKNNYGYLSEYHSFGETDEITGEKAEDLAAQMLATTLGIKFNADSSYNERKEIWRINDEIYRTTNITQSAIGDKNGLYTTTIAAAVLIS